MGGQAPMGSRFFISSGQMNCPSGNCRLGRQFYALRAGRWRSRGKQQIIYKHAISTIVPERPVPLCDPGELE